MTSRHANPPSMELLLSMIQVDAAAIALQGLERSGYLAAEAALPTTPRGDASRKQAVVLKLPVPSRKR
jgi:hypothetical protein